MNIACAHSAQLTGLHMDIITIEVDISNGLHSFSIVGLGDRAVDEAKDRVSAAIKNSGFTSPKQKNQKVVISLAPAHIRKEGPSFDLPMALAYLSAAGDISLETDHVLFLGELSLDGSIRGVRGVLLIIGQAISRGFTTIYIPQDNAEEASLVHGIRVYAVDSLRRIIDHLSHRERLEPISYRAPDTQSSDGHIEHDLSTIRGNETAKRGLEIAAAGAHNIAMYGPPGTGKTLLARSFSSILPDLDHEQSIEVTGIHSIVQPIEGRLITRPPFRTPHHTASYPSIVGGGSFPKPGEVTLAHRGVLFLDEFPEFDRDVIEALRQPLEERSITISRARGTVSFPAQCILIASMNPCPCGRGKQGGCVCPERLYTAYKRRISSPISDRIDIWIEVANIDYAKLADRDARAEASADVRARIERARQHQLSRYRAHGFTLRYNSEIGPRQIDACAMVDDEAMNTLRSAAERLSISGRAFHRTIKVARTIADLAGSTHIDRLHMLEALRYRERN